jgi:hypothetical protein
MVAISLLAVFIKEFNMLFGILASSSVNTGVDSDITSVFATPLTIKSNQPAFVQDSMNLKRIASSQNIQRWEITSNLAPTQGGVNNLLHSIRYGYNTLAAIRMPQPPGLVTTHFYVNGATLPSYEAGTFQIGRAYKIVTVGSTSFTSIGASSNTVGVQFTATAVGSGSGTATPMQLLTNGSIAANASSMSVTNAAAMVPGEFFSFVGYNKVYMVTLAGAGGAGINFTPRATSLIPTGTEIKVTAVTLIARYAQETTLGIVYSDGLLADPGSATFIEAL